MLPFMNEWKRCISCREMYMVKDLIEGTCTNCFDETDYGLYPSTSYTTFQYMQNIINDLKQQVYKLKLENIKLQNGQSKKV